MAAMVTVPNIPVEQLARDCKILAIYEGTNGIQSMDFGVKKTIDESGNVQLHDLQEENCVQLSIRPMA